VQPPPPRPRGVTFVAVVAGFLGAALMGQSLLEASTTQRLFPGIAGGAIAVSLVVANVCLIAGAVGMWWMREWGRALAFTGLGLRVLHDAAFAFHPELIATRGPYLLGVAVYMALAAYLVKARRAFVVR